MSKILIGITASIILIGAFIWSASIIIPVIQEVIPKPSEEPQENKLCETDEDCIAFGKTGECGCGCYNKDHLPSKSDEKCFCIAPTDCECVKGKCEGVFKDIDSFEDCVRVGYPVLETYPRQCKTRNEVFTEEFCKDEESGEILTLSEAKQIAIQSECGDNLEKTFSCNENSGTYWIDLGLEKEGCNPACVVDVVEKTASINWRCTGLKE